MKLFRMVDYELLISEEAYTIAVFKKLWKRDRSASKERANTELGFIYFYVDPRSDYSYIMDDELRLKEIKVGLGLPENWKIDVLLLEAIDFYKLYNDTPASLLLKDSMIGIENLRLLLRSIDLNEIEDLTKRIKATKEYTDIFNRMIPLVSLFTEALKAVNNELREKEENMRGQREATLWDNGIPDD